MTPELLDKPHFPYDPQELKARLYPEHETIELMCDRQVNHNAASTIVVQQKYSQELPKSGRRQF